MRSYRMTLAAGAQERMAISGTQFHIRSATGPVAVHSDTRDIEMSGLLPGEGSIGKRFHALSFRNSGASAITFEVVTSEEDFRTSRVYIADMVSTGMTNSVVTPGAGTVTLVAVANQIRVRFRCAVANTANVTVGGITYGPGEGDVIQTSGSIDQTCGTAAQSVEYSQEYSA